MGGREGNGGGSEGFSVLNRLMVKYRPIMPKPLYGGSTPLSTLPKRTKRRYVRTERIYREEQRGKQETSTDEQRVETLQLLPHLVEESGSGSSGIDRSKHSGGSSNFEVDSVVEDYSHWLSLGGGGDPKAAVGKRVPDPPVVMEQMGGVESWVTVECVRGSCIKAPSSSQGFEFPGVRVDEEIMMRLKKDECPGFISDGWNRVRWLNGAFRTMVKMTRLQPLTVLLWMNEELPHTTNSAFTCQVRLKYTVVEDQKKDKRYYYSGLVPCDLWRMNGGGFAWRLDVKAALTLGG
ncbi:uncharacterized protein LOC126785147 [Argentina anserina]|uniref:uncharacterized protein LOC126785147 n=1 Tax=Argentina anserina TaxID=57926 RepID=UPI00217692E1|nr:uncharacterized protein LOC126785147 [Potentilla anserina]